jgi:hypothetical protein
MSTRSTRVLLGVNAVLLAALLIYLVGKDAIAIAQPATEAGIVRAKLFELVAENGQVVAQLHAGEDGGGNLRLRSGSGTVRVKLGATSDGSGLILMDEHANPAIHFGSSKAGTKFTVSQ